VPDFHRLPKYNACVLLKQFQASTANAISSLLGFFHVIDDELLHHGLAPLQVQTQLLYRRERKRSAGIRYDTG
jgi:hypothetical protein